MSSTESRERKDDDLKAKVMVSIPQANRTHLGEQERWLLQLFWKGSYKWSRDFKSREIYQG